MPGDLDELTSEIRAFAQARDWHRYHAPKNLVMALSVEVAELMENFQWLTNEESDALDPVARSGVRWPTCRSTCSSWRTGSASTWSLPLGRRWSRTP